VPAFDGAIGRIRSPLWVFGAGRMMMSGAGLNRQNHDMAVPHAALGNDMPGECFYFRTSSPEYGDLKTGIVIDVHVKRRLCEIVVVVEILGQPFRQFAGGMIVDVTQRRDTLAIADRVVTGVFETAPHKIAERFRTIGVAALRDEFIHLGNEVVVDRDRQALHSRFSPGK
jgi:hypothetical protein